MPTYPLTVSGETYDVDFPHEAYDCQLAMMEKVIEALTRKRHALLESPTGASGRGVAGSRLFSPAPAPAVFVLFFGGCRPGRATVRCSLI